MFNSKLLKCEDNVKVKSLCQYFCILLAFSINTLQFFILRLFLLTYPNTSASSEAHAHTVMQSRCFPAGQWGFLVVKCLLNNLALQSKRQQIVKNQQMFYSWFCAEYLAWITFYFLFYNSALLIHCVVSEQPDIQEIWLTVVFCQSEKPVFFVCFFLLSDRFNRFQSMFKSLSLNLIQD